MSWSTAESTTTPVAPDDEATVFAAAVAEGPFGFKPDRNRPIEPHFDRFATLTPEQARLVLDVRDGRVRSCLLHLADESVLVEHAGQGYVDPITGYQWGYRVRRIGNGRPADAAAEAVPAAESAVVEPAAGEQTVVVPRHEPHPVDVAPVAVAAAPVEDTPAVVPSAVIVAKPATVDDGDEGDDGDESGSGIWSAPVRSPRAAAAALADPAERAALVRVLILWLVVGLLAAECAAVLAGRL